MSKNKSFKPISYNGEIGFVVLHEVDTKNTNLHLLEPIKVLY